MPVVTTSGGRGMMTVITGGDSCHHPENPGITAQVFGILGLEDRAEAGTAPAIGPGMTASATEAAPPGD
jgi:hypothetical protein